MDESNAVKQRLKSVLFGLLGKDPEAVVVSFCTGPPELARAMVGEAMRLVPDRRHYVVTAGPKLDIEGAELVMLPDVSAGELWLHLRRAFRRLRVGLAPTLFTSDARGRALLLAAILFAPGKILAYNSRLERHHIQLRSAIASGLFLGGVSLDRIFLRPRWWPGRKERTVVPAGWKLHEGRSPGPRRRRVGVLTPFLPYPLSHGGAVRIYNLLREIAREFDVYLFAFLEDESPQLAPLLEFCTAVITVGKPRYREPRWSTLAPPETHEYDSPAMREALARVRPSHGIELLQVEYTHLATYGGDVLVEHDVTFDLYQQVHARRRTLSSWWDLWRWRRFELRAVKRYQHVIVMSEKDESLLGHSRCLVIPNGVDLDRFLPAPEPDAQRLLFIGSFRHFPNVVAYRFFIEQVWPRLRDEFPELEVTVVAGPDPLLYWRAATDTLAPPVEERIQLLGYVADVCPLYQETTLALAPTLVSAGTNVKVLEAMAMERAVVSTPSGCSGIGLEHLKHAWIAEGAEEFAEGVSRLLRDPALRRSLATAARRLALERYSWRAAGEQQRAALHDLLGPAVRLRRGREADLDRVAGIQTASLPGSNWLARQYLEYEFTVALVGGRVAGFIVSRQTAPGEREILNLAVDHEYRRQGIGRRLMESELARWQCEFFLEVRESNTAARRLYEQLGFRDAGIRKGYYERPPESAIVMKMQTC